MPIITSTNLRTDWEYSVEKELRSPKTNETSKWADGHPKSWGGEFQSLKFDEMITAIDGSPDGRFLAVGSGKVVSIFEFDEVHDRFKKVEEMEGHVNAVKAVHWSPHLRKDGYLFLSVSAKGGGDEDPTLIIWSLTVDGRNATRSQVEPFSAEDLTRTTLNTILPGLPLWSPADAEAAGITSRLRGTISDAIAKHSILSQHVIPRANLSAWSSNQGSSPFSPTDPDIIAYISGRTTNSPPSNRIQPIRPVLYSISSRSAIHELPPANDRLIWQAFSPDGLNLATASWDQHVNVFSVKTGEVRFTFGPCGGQMWPGAWSSDSTLLAVPRGNPTTEIYVWDVSEDARHIESQKLDEERTQQGYVMVDENLDLQETPSPLINAQITMPTAATPPPPYSLLSPSQPPRPNPQPPPHRLLSTSSTLSTHGWTRSLSFQPSPSPSPSSSSSNPDPNPHPLLAAASRSATLVLLSPLTGRETTSFSLSQPHPSTNNPSSTPGQSALSRIFLMKLVEFTGIAWLSAGKELVWKNGNIDGGVEVWDLVRNERKRWGPPEKKGSGGDGVGGRGLSTVHGVVVLDRRRGGGEEGRRIVVSADYDGRVRCWDWDDQDDDVCTWQPVD